MNDPLTDKLDHHHRQQLSAMLDGELSPDEAKFMLRRLQHDGELAARWERWQVCGDILRGRHDALLPADFSRRVARAIEGGDAMAGRASADTHGGSVHAPRPWRRWGGGAALAASVAVAALFVARQAPDAAPSQLPGPVPQLASAPDEVPVPVAPQAPDHGTATLASVAAVAEVPRRLAERRERTRPAPGMTAPPRAPSVASAAPTRPASPAPGGEGTPAEVPERILAAAPVVAEDPFAVHPTAPTRPWPRAILPGFPADGAYSASLGQLPSSSFHPFEPRIPAPAPVAGRDGDHQPESPATGPR